MRAPTQMAAAHVATRMTNERTGSHHSAVPRYSRSGIPTGAENGTYDMTASTTGLSLKKITRKYGAMLSIVSGVVVAPMPPWRDTLAPAARRWVGWGTRETDRGELGGRRTN